MDPTTAQHFQVQTDVPPLGELAAAFLADISPAAVVALGPDPAAALQPLVEILLDQAATKAWIDDQTAKTGIRSMDFRNGVHMDLAPARETLAHLVAAARTMLGDAPNYSETKVAMDVKVAESRELFTIVIQRQAPDALTPHEARQRAETQRDELRFAVTRALDLIGREQHQPDSHTAQAAAILRAVLAKTDGTGRPSGLPFGASLRQQRAAMLAMMSATSEDRYAAGWALGLDHILHREGGLWETIGRTLGWPVGHDGDEEHRRWMTWDDAATYYAEHDAERSAPRQCWCTPADCAGCEEESR